ncbi:hypothetical protein HDU91_006989, partial [Kappamyces sp. JEL0680]
VITLVNRNPWFAWGGIEAAFMLGLFCNIIAMLNQRPGTGTSTAGFSAVSFSLLGNRAG